MCASLAVADLLFPKTVSLALCTLTRSSRAQIPPPHREIGQQIASCTSSYCPHDVPRKPRGWPRSRRSRAPLRTASRPPRRLSRAPGGGQQNKDRCRLISGQIWGSFVASKARAKCWACTGGGAGAFLSTGSGSQPELWRIGVRSFGGCWGEQEGIIKGHEKLQLRSRNMRAEREAPEAFLNVGNRLGQSGNDDADLTWKPSTPPSREHTSTTTHARCQERLPKTGPLAATSRTYARSDIVHQRSQRHRAPTPAIMVGM